MQRQEHKLDATNISCGRLASKIALLLRGKNKPDFTPHLDQGDAVIVENVAKMKISGNKLNGKVYYSSSQHPGGLKKTTLQDLIDKKGHAEVLRRAVYGMLPNNKLRQEMLKRLTIK